MPTHELAYKSIEELTEDSSAPAAGDWLVRWDDSAAVVKKVDATDMVAALGVTATVAELNLAADSSANVEIVTATNIITAAESGKTFFLNNATGFVSTLPAIAAGLRFKFVLTTVLSSGNHTVVTSDASNIIEGNLMVASTVVPAVNEDSINFLVTDGDVGDWCEVICDGTSWFLSGSATTASGMSVTAT